jgi:putative transposase
MRKKTRSSEDKVRSMLRDAEEAAKIETLQLQPAPAKAKPARRPRQNGLTPSDARRLKQLEEENRRLRSLVADLTLSNQALKLAVSKKW